MLPPRSRGVGKEKCPRTIGHASVAPDTAFHLLKYWRLQGVPLGSKADHKKVEDPADLPPQEVLDAQLAELLNYGDVLVPAAAPAVALVLVPAAAAPAAALVLAAAPAEAPPGSRPGSSGDPC